MINHLEKWRILSVQQVKENGEAVVNISRLDGQGFGFTTLGQRRFASSGGVGGLPGKNVIIEFDNKGFVRRTLGVRKA